MDAIDKYKSMEAINASQAPKKAEGTPANSSQKDHSD